MSGGTFSATQTAEAGCIVTFVELDSGQTKVIHGGGHRWERRIFYERSVVSYGVLDVLRELCQKADGWEGDWKVQSITTPHSILTDVRDGRERLEDEQPAHMPEPVLLSRIGRLDMWVGRRKTSTLKPRRRTRKRVA